MHPKFQYDELSPSCLVWTVAVPTVSILPGDPAGSLGREGYWVLNVKPKPLKVHRVIWELYNGLIPEGMQIDHINCNRSDNRIVNLRLATPNNNQWNTSKYSNNTSGFKCVSFDRESGKWRAFITVHGKRKWIGRYLSKEDAHKAYIKHCLELHGEFARVQ